MLIEVICPRSNQEITDIIAAYKSEFKRDLEKDVMSETSGHFRRLLVSCLQAARPEGPEVDQAKVAAEAKQLYEAGEAKWGTDESEFNRIISSRSFAQLIATFEEYTKVSQRTIRNSIKREFSGDVERAFMAVAWCIENRPQYFADRLYRSMIGAGTDDDTLIRLVVSRAEFDMVEIKKCFLEMFGKSLAKMIEGDCSGDYKRGLIAIVGTN